MKIKGFEISTAMSPGVPIMEDLTGSHVPALVDRIGPDALFQASFSVEPELRSHYLRLGSVPIPEDAGTIAPDTLVKRSAAYLELLLVAALITEALEEQGLRSATELTPAGASEIAETISRVYGLDVAEIAREAERHLHDLPSTDPDVHLPLDKVIRLLESTLEICPIDELESIAAASHTEVWGHRCRVAYDGIKAFVLRTSSKHRNRISVIGKAYAEGALSADDAATLLDLHVVDAVALLEDWGFKRSLDQIRLDEAERSDILARMRRDRLERDGEPSWTEESIARDVVASERIEGVDARRWIPRDGP